MSDDDWAPASASALAEVTGTGPRPAPTIEVPGYTDLREVARGGDSIVYRARQRSVDRDVAVKVITVTDPADVARFERELAITVRLGRQHPHIVTVLDTTTASTGEPCLVMEFHDLGSLHDRLRETGPLPVSDVVAAGTAVADALAFAHAHGVLHRDVKPQNILVLPTDYVLSDFGIARMADAGHTATLERFSYRHASPQVLDGLPPTEADDVWSLGSTLFTLLDGRAPFAADDPADDTALSYLRRVRTDQRRALTRADVPDELRSLIDDCLVPERDQRIGTAAEALRRLRRIRTEERTWNPEAAVVEAAHATRPRAADGASDGAAASGAPVAPVAAQVPEEEPAAPPDEEALWAPGAAPVVVEVKAPAPSASEPDDPGQPAAVAPSVLAHVGTDTAPPEPDADHTGLAPADDDAEGADGDDGTRGGRRARRGGGGGGDDDPSGWRRIAAFIGGALLVGAAIGVGSAVIQGMGEDETPTPPPTTADTGTIPVDPDGVSTDEPLNIQVDDAALSPVQFVIDRDLGSSIEVSWAEPEQAVDLYVVVSIDDPENPQEVLPVLWFPPPLTTATIEGLDPDAEGCYAVVGMQASAGEAGISNVDCR